MQRVRRLPTNFLLLFSSSPRFLTRSLVASSPPSRSLSQTGRYFGYRYPKETYGDTGIRSGIQMWNTPKDTPVLADEYLETDLLKVSAESLRRGRSATLAGC